MWRLPYFEVHSENKVRKSALKNLKELLVELKRIFHPFSWFEITHTGHIGATGISTRTQIARFIILRYHLPQTQHNHIKLSINSHIAVDLSIDLKVFGAFPVLQRED